MNATSPLLMRSSLLDAIKPPESPFPGLRPFEFNESHLFFGRDGQFEKLISNNCSMTSRTIKINCPSCNTR
ncbi:MAG: hypothetical protein SF339_08260 [Blastocatellia bacterium]|nr:hypothetical protein [Blastocatellia bacterium]